MEGERKCREDDKRSAGKGREGVTEAVERGWTGKHFKKSSKC